MADFESGQEFQVNFVNPDNSAYWSAKEIQFYISNKQHESLDLRSNCSVICRSLRQWLMIMKFSEEIDLEFS